MSGRHGGGGGGRGGGGQHHGDDDFILLVQLSWVGVLLTDRSVRPSVTTPPKVSFIIGSPGLLGGRSVRCRCNAGAYGSRHFLFPNRFSVVRCCLEMIFEGRRICVLRIFSGRGVSSSVAMCTGSIIYGY